MPSSTTTVLGVIGAPVEHSLSPAMHGAAIAALGLDAVYLAFRVEAEQLSGVPTAMRVLGLRGLNVTIPHKQAIMPLLDDLDQSALDAGCVNTIVNTGDRLVGHSTDGRGFLLSLEDAGVSLSGRRVVLVGSGGSARAVASAIASQAAGLHIAARNALAAEAVAELIKGRLTAGVTVGPLNATALSEALRAADVLVNTTPIGMWPRTDEVIPLHPGALRPDLTVVDIVYNPPCTRLLRAAEQAGCVTVGGLGMLVRQGALSLELWTGRTAPVAAMRKAAEQALARFEGGG